MRESITWVGMDAHKDSISVAMRRPETREFVEWTVSNEPRAIKRLARRLLRQASAGEVRACYEAGACGYALQRQLEQSEYEARRAFEQYDEVDPRNRLVADELPLVRGAALPPRTGRTML